MKMAAHIQKLEGKHGSLRAAAKAVKLDAGYLCRIKAGTSVPSRNAAKKLGLERVISFVPIAKTRRKAQPGENHE